MIITDLSSVDLNSIDAYLSIHADGEVSRREKEIIGALLKLTVATDRQIAAYLGRNFVSYVQPRITEMIQKKLLVRAGDTIDPVTHKRVRLVKLKPAPGRQ
jgi:hypothetical protein